MTKLAPIHPGEILNEEFLLPLGLSARALARAIKVPANRVSRLVAGDSAITPDTAMRLARAFRTTPEFWLNLQLRFDLLSAEDAAVPMDDIEPLVA